MYRNMICNYCDYAGRPTYDYPCSSCDMVIGSLRCKWKSEEKQTNADYIRKMTDEELTTLVRAVIKVEDCPAIKDSDCDKCFFRRLCPVGYKYVGRELEWLQQPMED